MVEISLVLSASPLPNLELFKSISSNKFSKSSSDSLPKVDSDITLTALASIEISNLPVLMLSINVLHRYSGSIQ